MLFVSNQSVMMGSDANSNAICNEYIPVCLLIPRANGGLYSLFLSSGFEPDDTLCCKQ